MRSTDFEAKKRMKEALAERGLAVPEILHRLKTGSVVLVNDSAISLPEGRLPKAGPRTMHEKRRAIVVQRKMWINAAEPPTLLVVPCSASADKVLPCDLQIPDDEPHFTKEKIVAFVSLIQPVLKSDVTSVVGDLCDGTRIELLKKLASIVDLG
jgi:mRNA-degrading endonuclease toxin of MazEF toxin-antitoxin module